MIVFKAVKKEWSDPEDEFHSLVVSRDQGYFYLTYKLNQRTTAPERVPRAWPMAFRTAFDAIQFTKNEGTVKYPAYILELKSDKRYKEIELVPSVSWESLHAFWTKSSAEWTGSVNYLGPVPYGTIFCESLIPLRVIHTLSCWAQADQLADQILMEPYNGL